MTSIQKSRHCKQCGKTTLHSKELMVGNGMGCLLTVLTIGLFIPVWLLVGVIDAFRPARCQSCGSGRLT